MLPLKNKIAVVAGATRGAGRGIACMLGEAGATVYCTGRSLRGRPSVINRPETIEETAEMVTAYGGLGIWVQIDHSQPEQVQTFFEHLHQEQDGHLDLLVNNISGDSYYSKEILSGKRHELFWEASLEKGLLAQQQAVHTHIITSYYAAPLMVANRSGLIIEITDGNCLGYNNCGVFYSLNKTSAVSIAYFMSEELRPYNVAALSLTPGYLRSEEMLEGFGVKEVNWKDAILIDPGFADSETPFYIGRAVVALASDPKIMGRSGHALSAGYLAREYGFTDLDNTQPPGYCREGVFDKGEFLYI